MLEMSQWSSKTIWYDIISMNYVVCAVGVVGVERMTERV